MSEQEQIPRCGTTRTEISLANCSLCGEALSDMTSYGLQDDPVCLNCLLYLGPERTQILLKVKKIDPVEIAFAVTYLRSLLTRNQTLRLREAIRTGGRNWWVKLPEFGEYICRMLSMNGTGWGNEVLDEVWDQLIEEAVEE